MGESCSPKTDERFVTHARLIAKIINGRNDDEKVNSISAKLYSSYLNEITYNGEEHE